MNKKYTLITLILMLLTTLMPPMAFACVTACTINCQQVMAHTKSETEQIMSPCHHEQKNLAPLDASKTHKATPCLAHAICHLTIGINSTTLQQSFLHTSSTLLTYNPDFTLQIFLSPPKKPPRS